MSLKENKAVNVLTAEKGTETFFVILKNPVEFRRNALESMKLLIRQLQRFEHFKELRATKTELMNQLRFLMKEIDGLAGRLKMKIPKLHIGKTEIEKYRKTYTGEDKEGIATLVSSGEAVGKSDVDLLSDQLNSIESQLNDLK